MYTPKEIFGRSAKPRGQVVPELVSSVLIGDLTVEVMRYHVSDFIIENFPVTDGNFVIYRVVSDVGDEFLQQRRSVFFTSSDTPIPENKDGNVTSCFGSNVPKWHKIDRSWPAHDGRAFSFLGQGYYGDNVFYLFAESPEQKCGYVVFHDDVSRQDLDDHYKLEQTDQS